MEKEIFAELRERLKRGQVENALKELDAFLKERNIQKFSDQLIQQYSLFNQLQQKKHKNVITEEKQSVALSKITDSLLEIIDDLEEYLTNGSINKSTDIVSQNNNIGFKIMLAVIFMLPILYFFWKNDGIEAPEESQEQPIEEALDPECIMRTMMVTDSILRLSLDVPNHMISKSQTSLKNWEGQAQDALASASKVLPSFNDLKDYNIKRHSCQRKELDQVDCLKAILRQQLNRLQNYK